MRNETEGKIEKERTTERKKYTSRKSQHIECVAHHRIGIASTRRCTVECKNNFKWPLPLSTRGELKCRSDALAEIETPAKRRSVWFANDSMFEAAQLTRPKSNYCSAARQLASHTRPLTQFPSRFDILAWAPRPHKHKRISQFVMSRACGLQSTCADTVPPE